jgi:hypothetical protein
MKNLTWLLVAAAAAAPAWAGRLEPGQPFPSTYLPYLEGDKAGSIADFRGQKVVLHVFASW